MTSSCCICCNKPEKYEEVLDLVSSFVVDDSGAAVSNALLLDDDGMA